MGKMIKNALILAIITCVAGLGLGVVYEITKDPIAVAQEKAKQEAYQSVLSDATEFETISDFADREASESVEANQILADAGFADDLIDEVAEGKDDSGETVGYVITVTSKEGYGGDIKISTGIAADGTVKGISMLSISETAGLGMQATEESWMNQFKDKAVEQFEYTKSGASEDGQIDALSGATITTNAVTNDVNAALAYYTAVLAEGGNN